MADKEISKLNERLEEAFQYIPSNFREKLISLKTYERVKIAKSYIEKKYKMKHVKELEKKRGIV